MDPLISIPVEEVDADVVLGMKEKPVLTDQEVIDSGAQKRVVPTSGVMYDLWMTRFAWQWYV